MKKLTQEKKRGKSTKKKEKMLTPYGMLLHEISAGRISEFKFKMLKDKSGKKCLGEAHTSGHVLRKDEPSKIYIHPITVVHSFTHPVAKAVAILRGADKKTMRQMEERHRSFEEVLIHELHHHIEPYASEREIIRRTKKSMELQTKKVFRKRRKSRAEKIKVKGK